MSDMSSREVCPACGSDRRDVCLELSFVSSDSVEMMIWAYVHIGRGRGMADCRHKWHSVDAEGDAAEVEHGVCDACGSRVNPNGNCSLVTCKRFDMSLLCPACAGTHEVRHERLGRDGVYLCRHPFHAELTLGNVVDGEGRA